METAQDSPTSLSRADGLPRSVSGSLKAPPCGFHSQRCHGGYGHGIMLHRAVLTGSSKEVELALRANPGACVLPLVIPMSFTCEKQITVAMAKQCSKNGQPF